VVLYVQGVNYVEIYIRGKREYFYINDKVSTMLRGESLIDYIYGDFNEVYDMMIQTQEILRAIRSGKEVEENIRKLRSYADLAEKHHIYFHAISDYIRETIIAYDRTKKIDNVKYLSHISEDIRELQDMCLELLETCFDMDDDSKLSAPEKYINFLDKQKGTTVFEPKIYSMTLKAVKAEGKMVFVDVVTPHDFFDIIYFFTSYFLKNDVKFRKCKYCGKYFVPETARMDYCTRKIEGSTKTCRDLGSVKNYQAQAFNHEAAKVYNRAYKTMFSRMKYQTNPLTEEEFKEWAIEARELRDKCIPGSSDYDNNLERLKIWLDKHVWSVKN